MWSTCTDITRLDRLNNALATTEEWKAYTKEMFDLVDAGVVRVRGAGARSRVRSWLIQSSSASSQLLISETYPFTADGLRDAHKALTGRQTVGKLVIEVSKE